MASLIFRYEYAIHNRSPLRQRTRKIQLAKGDPRPLDPTEQGRDLPLATHRQRDWGEISPSLWKPFPHAIFVHLLFKKRVNYG